MGNGGGVHICGKFNVKYTIDVPSFPSSFTFPWWSKATPTECLTSSSFDDALEPLLFPSCSLRAACVSGCEMELLPSLLLSLDCEKFSFWSGPLSLDFRFLLFLFSFFSSFFLDFLPFFSFLDLDLKIDLLFFSESFCLSTVKLLISDSLCSVVMTGALFPFLDLVSLPKTFWNILNVYYLENNNTCLTEYVMDHKQKRYGILKYCDYLFSMLFRTSCHSEPRLSLCL